MVANLEQGIASLRSAGRLPGPEWWVSVRDGYVAGLRSAAVHGQVERERETLKEWHALLLQAGPSALRHLPPNGLSDDALQLLIEWQWIWLLVGAEIRLRLDEEEERVAEIGDDFVARITSQLLGDYFTGSTFLNNRGYFPGPHLDARRPLRLLSGDPTVEGARKVVRRLLIDFVDQLCRSIPLVEPDAYDLGARGEFPVTISIGAQARPGYCIELQVMKASKRLQGEKECLLIPDVLRILKRAMDRDQLSTYCIEPETLKAWWEHLGADSALPGGTYRLCFSRIRRSADASVVPVEPLLVEGRSSGMSVLRALQHRLVYSSYPDPWPVAATGEVAGQEIRRIQDFLEKILTISQAHPGEVPVVYCGRDQVSEQDRQDLSRKHGVAIEVRGPLDLLETNPHSRFWGRVKPAKPRIPPTVKAAHPRSRHEPFTQLMKRLREPSEQFSLLEGPRGVGKSYLVAAAGEDLCRSTGDIQQPFIGGLIYDLQTAPTGQESHPIWLRDLYREATIRLRSAGRLLPSQPPWERIPDAASDFCRLITKEMAGERLLIVLENLDRRTGSDAELCALVEAVRHSGAIHLLLVNASGAPLPDAVSWTAESRIRVEPLEESEAVELLKLFDRTPDQRLRSEAAQPLQALVDAAGCNPRCLQMLAGRLVSQREMSVGELLLECQHPREDPNQPLLEAALERLFGEASSAEKELLLLLAAIQEPMTRDELLQVYEQYQRETSGSEVELPELVRMLSRLSQRWLVEVDPLRADGIELPPDHLEEFGRLLGSYATRKSIIQAAADHFERSLVYRDEDEDDVAEQDDATNQDADPDWASYYKFEDQRYRGRARHWLRLHETMPDLPPELKQLAFTYLWVGWFTWWGLVRKWSATTELVQFWRETRTGADARWLADRLDEFDHVFPRRAVATWRDPNLEGWTKTWETLHRLQQGLDLWGDPLDQLAEAWGGNARHWLNGTRAFVLNFRAGGHFRSGPELIHWDFDADFTHAVALTRNTEELRWNECYLYCEWADQKLHERNWKAAVSKIQGARSVLDEDDLEQSSRLLRVAGHALLHAAKEQDTAGQPHPELVRAAVRALNHSVYFSFCSLFEQPTMLDDYTVFVYHGLVTDCAESIARAHDGDRDWQPSPEVRSALVDGLDEARELWQPVRDSASATHGPLSLPPFLDGTGGGVLRGEVRWLGTLWPQLPAERDVTYDCPVNRRDYAEALDRLQSWPEWYKHFRMSSRQSAKQTRNALADLAVELGSSQDNEEGGDDGVEY